MSGIIDVHEAMEFEQQNRFNRNMNRWTDLPGYAAELQGLISESSAPLGDGGGTKNRGGGASFRAPWNSGAAGLFFEIHAEVRRVESALTLTLEHRAVYRGGSDVETARVFDRLPILLRALHDRDPESEVLAEVFHALGSLTKRARAALHPEERRARALFVSCHVCGGDLWIYRAGQDVARKLLESEHFQPGDAYCNRCATFYPLDIWERVARDNAGVA